MSDADPFSWRNREATLRQAIEVCTYEEIGQALHTTLNQADCQKLSNLFDAWAKLLDASATQRAEGLDILYGGDDDKV